MFDIKDLRYFVAVAERLSISRAAEAVNITQSALSRSIQKLERDIGVVLFERRGRSLQLTAEGADFQHEATVLLDHAQAVANRASDLRAGHVGYLKIGATAQTIASLLSPVLLDFNTQHPNVEISIHEGSNETLLDLVERGSVNLAIAAPSRYNTLQHVELFVARLLVFLRAQDARSRQEAISVSQIANDPLLVLRRGFMTRDLFERACSLARFRPRIMLESDNPHTLVRLAQDGHGVAVLSSTAAIEPIIKKAVPLTHLGRPITQKVSAVWNPERHEPPAFAPFLQLIREHAARVHNAQPAAAAMTEANDA